MFKYWYNSQQEMEYALKSYGHSLNKALSKAPEIEYVSRFYPKHLAYFRIYYNKITGVDTI